MLRNAEDFRDGIVQGFDVAIVGAGMAGITLAERLRGDGRRVCLIEGGGLDPEPAAQRLLVGENVGRPYFRLHRSRFRVFGGSSIRWGGWCRPLDPADFRARAWIPRSGWPIDDADLRPHYRAVAAMLGLETADFAFAEWRDRLPAAPDCGGSSLQPGIIQHGTRVDFGERWRAGLGGDSDVTVLLHANVTELVLNRSGDRLDHLVAASSNRRRFRVRAGTFVLAAGGIENARLLLASQGHASSGIGNTSDQVGRCFMEHLHVAPALLIADVEHGLSPFFAHRIGDRAPAHGVLMPTEAALAEARVSSCSVSFATRTTAMDAIPRLNWPTVAMTTSEGVARRLRRDHPGIDRQLRGVALTAWRIERDRQRRRDALAAGAASDEVSFAFFRAEQTPNPDSRITLSQRRDALGMPRVRLDWRVSKNDLGAIARWTECLSDVCATAGLGRVVPRTGWEREIVGGPHHMGTTRMSASPDDGVVDANCRVHGVGNLYVAGSSVFTTGGHANPSYTLLALTLRLAQHLRGEAAPAPSLAGTVDTMPGPTSTSCLNV